VLCHNETKQRLSAAESRFSVAASATSDLKLVTAAAATLLPPPPPPPMAPPPPRPPGPPPPPLMHTSSFAASSLSVYNGTNGGNFSSSSSLSETEQLKQVIRKCVPQPSNPLKSFNWSKLPECKVQGTIWTDLDDSKLYKQLDLGEVDRLFSAYQKNGIMVSHFFITKMVSIQLKLLFSLC
jgi:Formin Homology 2 Domain